MNPAYPLHQLFTAVEGAVFLAIRIQAVEAIPEDVARHKTCTAAGKPLSIWRQLAKNFQTDKALSAVFLKPPS